MFSATTSFISLVLLTSFAPISKKPRRIENKNAFFKMFLDTAGCVAVYAAIDNRIFREIFIKLLILFRVRVSGKNNTTIRDFADGFLPDRYPHIIIVFYKFVYVD